MSIRAHPRRLPGPPATAPAGHLTMINRFQAATATISTYRRGEAVMEFHIKTRGVKPDLYAINSALRDVDPMAVADIGPEGASLRVAVELGSPELLALLTRAGYPVDWRQLEQVPSVCCGACGG